MFLEISIALATALIGYLAFDKLWLERRKKLLGRITRILLFEKVGEDKVYKGSFKGYEEQDDKLGVYIMIGKIKKAISVVNNKDYFPDKSFGKCLMVCKYSEDDYRTMARLQEKSWFVEAIVPPKEYLKTVLVSNEETGENQLVYEKDKKGDYVCIDENDEIELDENDEPVPITKLIKYKDPIGINQEGREAMRFNRSFVRRMQEKRNETGGFWDKYGSLLLSAGVVMIALLFMTYNSNQTNETQIYIADVFKEEADKAVKEISQPMWAENLLSAIDKRNSETEAPPK